MMSIYSCQILGRCLKRITIFRFSKEPENVASVYPMKRKYPLKKKKNITYFCIEWILLMGAIALTSVVLSNTMRDFESSQKFGRSSRFFSVTSLEKCRTLFLSPAISHNYVIIPPKIPESPDSRKIYFFLLKQALLKSSPQLSWPPHRDSKSWRFEH